MHELRSQNNVVLSFFYGYVIVELLSKLCCRILFSYSILFLLTMRFEYFNEAIRCFSKYFAIKIQKEKKRNEKNQQTQSIALYIFFKLYFQFFFFICTARHTYDQATHTIIMFK